MVPSISVDKERFLTLVSGSVERLDAPSHVAKWSRSQTDLVYSSREPAIRQVLRVIVTAATVFGCYEYLLGF